jgi:Tfp pilus assembly protein PilX
MPGLLHGHAGPASGGFGQAPEAPGLPPDVVAPCTQRGGTLLVVMVMLLVASLLGLMGFRMARGQLDLAANLQFQEQAFGQAEATMAVAEGWMSAGTNARTAAFSTYDASSPGLYPAGKLLELGLDPATMTWTDSNSIAVSEGRYLIERIGRGISLPGASMQVGQASTGACRSVDLFRIVSQSASIRGASRTIETYRSTSGCY